MSAALAFAPAAEKASAEAANSAAPSLALVKNTSASAARALAALEQMLGYYTTERA